MREPFDLGPMPVGRAMKTIDEQLVRSPLPVIFDLARAVEHWPAHLAHYRFVRYREEARDGGGLVEMSANRPFGFVNWPTWWLSEMSVDHDRHCVRFRHVGGLTTRMEVEWSFLAVPNGTQVRLVHLWNGPEWPLIGVFTATAIIGPIFVHGIASRTLRGLARVAERHAMSSARTGEYPLPVPRFPVTGST
jgi:hypothetical protein